MPYRSKAQMRLFFAKEHDGELPKGTARRWAHHTKNIKKLPQHVKKKASLEMAIHGLPETCDMETCLKTAMDLISRNYRAYELPTLMAKIAAMASLPAPPGKATMPVGPKKPNAAAGINAPVAKPLLPNMPPPGPLLPPLKMAAEDPAISHSDMAVGGAGASMGLLGEMVRAQRNRIHTPNWKTQGLKKGLRTGSAAGFAATGLSSLMRHATKESAHVPKGGTVSYDYFCSTCREHFDQHNGNCPLCGKNCASTTTNPKLVKKADDQAVKEATGLFEVKPKKEIQDGLVNQGAFLAASAPIGAAGAAAYSGAMYNKHKRLVDRIEPLSNRAVAQYAQRSRTYQAHQQGHDNAQSRVDHLNSVLDGTHGNSSSVLNDYEQHPQNVNTGNPRESARNMIVRHRDRESQMAARSAALRDHEFTRMNAAGARMGRLATRGDRFLAEMHVGVGNERLTRGKAMFNLAKNTGKVMLPGSVGGLAMLGAGKLWQHMDKKSADQSLGLMELMGQGAAEYLRKQADDQAQQAQQPAPPPPGQFKPSPILSNVTNPSSPTAQWISAATGTLVPPAPPMDPNQSIASGQQQQNNIQLQKTAAIEELAKAAAAVLHKAAGGYNPANGGPWTGPGQPGQGFPGQPTPGQGFGQGFPAAPPLPPGMGGPGGAQPWGMGMGQLGGPSLYGYRPPMNPQNPQGMTNRTGTNSANRGSNRAKPPAKPLKADIPTSPFDTPAEAKPLGGSSAPAPGGPPTAPASSPGASATPGGPGGLTGPPSGASATPGASGGLPPVPSGPPPAETPGAWAARVTGGGTPGGAPAAPGGAPAAPATSWMDRRAVGGGPAGSAGGMGGVLSGAVGGAGKPPVAPSGSSSALGSALSAAKPAAPPAKPGAPAPATPPASSPLLGIGDKPVPVAPTPDASSAKGAPKGPAGTGEKPLPAAPATPSSDAPATAKGVSPPTPTAEGADKPLPSIRDDVPRSMSHFSDDQLRAHGYTDPNTDIAGAAKGGPDGGAAPVTRKGGWGGSDGVAKPEATPAGPEGGAKPYAASGPGASGAPITRAPGYDPRNDDIWDTHNRLKAMYQPGKSLADVNNESYGAPKPPPTAVAGSSAGGSKPAPTEAPAAPAPAPAAAAKPAPPAAPAPTGTTAAPPVTPGAAGGAAGAATAKPGPAAPAPGGEGKGSGVSGGSNPAPSAGAGPGAFRKGASLMAVFGG